MKNKAKSVETIEESDNEGDKRQSQPTDLEILDQSVLETLFSDEDTEESSAGASRLSSTIPSRPASRASSKQRSIEYSSDAEDDFMIIDPPPRPISPKVRPGMPTFGGVSVPPRPIENTQDRNFEDFEKMLNEALAESPLQLPTNTSPSRPHNPNAVATSPHPYFMFRQ